MSPDRVALMGKGDLKPIRTYAVTVEGFPPVLYSARSPGKARSHCFGDWRSGCGGDAATFSGFLRISTVRLADNPPGIGERILVCGKPATRVIGRGNSIAFMRDDGDCIMVAHPSEVSALSSSHSTSTK